MISQSEANYLIKMPKKKAKDESYDFPNAGMNLVIPIISKDDEKTSFLIDLNRGRVKLTKCTYQERYQGTIILVRLDIDGSPHENPSVHNIPFCLLPYNGVTLPTPHLHLYIEGFMDKWAIPISRNEFPQTHDLYMTLENFFRFCNVIEPPTIQRGLFK